MGRRVLQGSRGDSDRGGGTRRHKVTPPHRALLVSGNNGWRRRDHFPAKRRKGRREGGSARVDLSEPTKPDGHVECARGVTNEESHINRSGRPAHRGPTNPEVRVQDAFTGPQGPGGDHEKGVQERHCNAHNGLPSRPSPPRCAPLPLNLSPRMIWVRELEMRVRAFSCRVCMPQQPPTTRQPPTFTNRPAGPCG